MTEIEIEIEIGIGEILVLIIVIVGKRAVDARMNASYPRRWSDAA